MASSREYLDFVTEQLSGVDGLSYRPMMGEYILYVNGKSVGGIYDDRLLLKATKTALALMRETAGGVQTDLPYPGAKEMLVADPDNREFTCRVLRAIAAELPEKEKRSRAAARKEIGSEGSE